MYIETKRLTVRTLRESDAEALYKIKTDPQVRKYIPDFLDLDAQFGVVPHGREERFQTL